MKPPSRTRTKPDRSLKAEPVGQRSGRLACKWQRGDKRKLLNALKRLSRTTGTHEDIDYAFLRKCVPSRSISEIHSVVESLKNKLISRASFTLKKKSWEETKVRKPIEAWMHMASAVAGTLVDPISTAFAQMLTVSSAEPRTLNNCDPPKVHRPRTDEDRPVGRTVPLRPMPRLPVQVKHAGTSADSPLRVLKTQAPSNGPSKGLQVPTVGPSKGLQAATQVARVPDSNNPSPQQQPATTAGTSPATTSCQPGVAGIVGPSTPSQTVTAPGFSSAAAAVKTVDSSSRVQTTQQPPERRPAATASTPKADSSSPRTPLASASSCSSTRSAPPLSSPAAACHTRFGRTSKYATEDSPRMFGVKCVVDFERIYRYLSDIVNPSDECHLTPMESAILLDLLMSLPEEIPLLDCHKLHKHLIQVHRCLSCPADTKVAREMFRDLKEALGVRTEAQGARTEAQGARTEAQGARTEAQGARTEAQGARTEALGARTEAQGARTEALGGQGGDGTGGAESQLGRDCEQPVQLGEAELTGLCPPLNPFMVPLKLLRRRKVRVPNE